MQNEENLTNKVEVINSDLVKANAFNEDAALTLDLIYNFISENRNIFGTSGSSMPNLDSFFDKNGYVPVKVLNPCCHKKEENNAAGDDNDRKRRPKDKPKDRQRQGQPQTQQVLGEIFVPQLQQVPSFKPVVVPLPHPISTPIPLTPPSGVVSTPPATMPTPAPIDAPIVMPTPEAPPDLKGSPVLPPLTAPDLNPVPREKEAPIAAMRPDEGGSNEFEGLVPENWYGEQFEFSPDMVVPGENGIPENDLEGLGTVLNLLSYLVPYLGEVKAAKTIYDLYKMFRSAKNISDFLGMGTSGSTGNSPSGFKSEYLSPVSYSTRDNAVTDEITLKADEIKFISDVIRFKKTGISQQPQQTYSSPATQDVGYQPPPETTTPTSDGNNNVSAGDGNNSTGSHESRLNGNQSTEYATPETNTATKLMSPMNISSMIGLNGIGRMGSSMSSAASFIGKTLSDLSSKTFMTAKVPPPKAEVESIDPTLSQPIVYESKGTGHVTSAVDKPIPAMTLFEQDIFMKSGFFEKQKKGSLI